MDLIREELQFFLEEKNNTIIAIFGPSGSGKSRQKNIFKKYGWKELVSLVTRPPRSELDVEYNFTPEKEWLKKYENGELINTNEYGGNYYGTRLEDFLNTKKAILVTDETNIDGSRGENDLKNVASKHGKNLILVFSAPPNEKELERRHKSRLEKGEYKSEEEYESRLSKAREEAENMKEKIKSLNVNKFTIYNDEDAEVLAQELN
tara:strand:+ start:840 stop:1457 length:618 start_codon:yes stop_codon:yes gene_type:complete